MKTDRKNNRPGPNTRDMNPNRLERNSSSPNDLHDSKEDQEKLQQEETFIDLPDVKHIPGQEFVNAPPAGVLGDTAISSADEEGTTIFDNDDESLKKPSRKTGREQLKTQALVRRFVTSKSWASLERKNLELAICSYQFAVAQFS